MGLQKYPRLLVPFTFTDKVNGDKLGNLRSWFMKRHRKERKAIAVRGNGLPLPYLQDYTNITFSELLPLGYCLGLHVVIKQLVLPYEHRNVCKVDDVIFNVVLIMWKGTLSLFKTTPVLHHLSCATTTSKRPWYFGRIKLLNPCPDTKDQEETQNLNSPQENYLPSPCPWAVPGSLALCTVFGTLLRFESAWDSSFVIVQMEGTSQTRTFI